MGAWDDGIWDNDHAADLISEILDFVEEKFYNEGEGIHSGVKRGLSDDEVIALADFILMVDNRVSLGRPSGKLINGVYLALLDLHANKSYKRFKNYEHKRRQMKNLINRLAPRVVL